MSKLLDLDGRKFGLWTVQFRLPNAMAECHCECGMRKAVNVQSLIRGLSKSCGCETGKLISASKIRHGGARRSKYSPEYNSWRMMKERCFSPKHKHYQNYGGRGILICERWADFSSFLADMGPRPDGKSLDRIDTDGNYEPGNCKWSTRSEQSFGRRPYKHTKKREYKNK